MNFKIEQRSDGHYVVHESGWARPASADEVAMWNRIVELETVLTRITLGTDGDRAKDDDGLTYCDKHALVIPGCQA